jgi:phosphoglucosamine mutase
MMEHRYILGGENSGHIIFFEKATTGDGQLTAILLLCAMKGLGMTAEQVYEIFAPYPRRESNILADDLQKKKLMKDEAFLRDIAKAEASFAGKGRILVRPSGTEPYIRILVEGKEEQAVLQTAEALKEAAEIRLSQLF